MLRFEHQANQYFSAQPKNISTEKDITKLYSSTVRMMQEAMQHFEMECNSANPVELAHINTHATKTALPSCHH